MGANDVGEASGGANAMAAEGAALAVLAMTLAWVGGVACAYLHRWPSDIQVAVS